MKTSKKPCIVGFDLGGTKMLATVFDAGGKVLGRCKRNTGGFGDADTGLGGVAATIDAALKTARITRVDLAGIGMGCPGPVDSREGVLFDPPNLGCRDLPVGKMLRKEFGCPVMVLNDVDAGTYGETVFGAGRGQRCVLGVFPGTGIGGGCVYDGAIVRGGRISAMEIGHLCVLPEGPLCGCGRRGCLEAVASRLAIAQAAAVAAYQGKAPYLRAHAGTDVGQIRSGMLAAAIANGDQTVEDIVRHAAGWLGRGVAMVANLMLPDVVVLGGGLVEAMPALYLKEVRAAARGHVMPAFEKRFQVRVAKLGDDAVVRGAAAWAATAVGAGGPV